MSKLFILRLNRRINAKSEGVDITVDGLVIP